MSDIVSGVLHDKKSKDNPNRMIKNKTPEKIKHQRDRIEKENRKDIVKSKGEEYRKDAKKGSGKQSGKGSGKQTGKGSGKATGKQNGKGNQKGKKDKHSHSPSSVLNKKITKIINHRHISHSGKIKYCLNENSPILISNRENFQISNRYY